MSTIRPVVVASSCLGTAKVRYDGQAIQDRFFVRLSPFVRVVAVCPEMEIGLGTPRETIHVEGRGPDRRLVQPSTGRDLTSRMERFGARFLGSLGEVDGFLLKSRSPSCGVRDVKAVDPKTNQPLSKRESGLFAEAVMERFPGAAIEDEGRMTNLAIREHFLTRIFANARLRRVRRASHLVAFHARHKLLLMACSEKDLRELGRLVASNGTRPFDGLLEEYVTGFGRALSKPPRRTAQVNALQHAMGYFSGEIGRKEKTHFLRCMDEFKAGLLPLSVPLAVLRSWMARHEQPYLEDQAFLDPFPAELADPVDSGSPRSFA